MATTKAQMTDREMNAHVDAALARAAAVVDDEPRILSVAYRAGAGLDLFIFCFDDGRRLLIPREDLEGLATAGRSALTDYRIIGGGTGVWWNRLDTGFHAAGLLKGVYGSRRWMAELQRRRKAALLRDRPTRRSRSIAA